MISVCLGGAVNGLVVPFYEGLAASGPIEQQELARQVMGFGWSLNQGLIQVGIVAESAGILCWSVMLLRQHAA
ncbi:MAG: hypothetical protein CK529_08610 [Rhodospirillaceae bacterium]|nr:MAG: hypothetical protein CK529_08610 [Rhodospirillaceae bacterium]